MLGRTHTPEIPSITLNNGVTIPQVGFGVFMVPPDETQRAVESALEIGYRHIDTAAAYENEAGVGAAIRASGLPRDEVFVVTKLRNSDQGYAETLAAFAESKRQLGLDVVDLYLIHWPFPHLDKYVDTWRAFEKIYAAGEVRAIGVSNFKESHLARLDAETDIVPAVNQVEVHPSFQDPATSDASTRRGIVVEAYAPLGRGDDLTNSTVTEIADAHDVTPAQAVLRWHIQHGRIVIPKSVHPDRQRANLDVVGFELSAGDMARIDALEAGARWSRDPDVMNWNQLGERPW